MIFLFQGYILRFQDNFRGCTSFHFHPDGLTSNDATWFLSFVVFQIHTPTGIEWYGIAVQTTNTRPGLNNRYNSCMTFSINAVVTQQLSGLELATSTFAVVRCGQGIPLQVFLVPVRCSSSHCGRRLVGWDDQRAALHSVFAVMFYTKYCCLGERGKIHCLMVNNNSRTSNQLVLCMLWMYEDPCCGWISVRPLWIYMFESCGIYFDPREVYWDKIEDYCDSAEILRVCVPSRGHFGSHKHFTNVSTITPGSA